MSRSSNAVSYGSGLLLRLGHDESAQDMIEYALLAAAVAVIVAAFIPTEVVPVMSSLYSKITLSLNAS